MTRRFPPRRRRNILLATALALAAGTAQAQTWRLQPYVSVQETLTNNVDLLPSDRAQSDLVTQITPGLTVSGNGARTSLNGFVAAPILLYARTGAENNEIYPTVGLNGSVEAIENFFYVEGSISVSQQFFTPFGAQPADLASATQNRYTSAAYSVSPYIKGVTGGNISYLLRNNNTWSNLSGTPIDVDNAYYNQWIGNVASPVAPFGWAVDFDRSDVKFNNQDPQLTQLARLRALYKVNAQLQVSASGGYEDNRFPFTDYSGAIYGAAMQWRPTERTNVIGNWEHRFFGASYLLSFDHRTPLSAWRVSASRNITSYPQNIGTLGAGGDVATLLSSLFTSKIPDPTQRQTIVDQFIEDHGLPQVLSDPVNLYTQQLTLQEEQSASFGLLGARNSIFFAAYNLKSTPIAGSGNALPPILAGGNDNTQRGGSVTWSHALARQLNVVASASTLLTLANAPAAGKSSQSSINLSVSSPLSARTVVFAGARYQLFDSDVAADYNEAAVFAGFNYTFR